MLAAEVAHLEQLIADLPPRSGARWLLGCARKTLIDHKGSVLHRQWDDWDPEGIGDDLTPLTPHQRHVVGQVALRLGTLADEAPDPELRSACEDAARGLYMFLMPDTDLD